MTVDRAHGDGWAALADGRWADARTLFRQALSAGERPEALEGLSWAAWWLDDAPTVFDARSRAYALFRHPGAVHAERARRGRGGVRRARRDCPLDRHPGAPGERGPGGGDARGRVRSSRSRPASAGERGRRVRCGGGSRSRPPRLAGSWPSRSQRSGATAEADRSAGLSAAAALGDYRRFARETVWEVGPVLVEACGVRPGLRVLDVASDLTPEHFEAGRQEARDAGVEIEWVEADAEALPFDDDSFAVVTSAFGAMFAADHEAVADELLRVCRRGGTIAALDADLAAFAATANRGSPGEPAEYVYEYLLVVAQKR